MNKEKQKQEAIKRMKLLKIHINAVNEFIKHSTINKSEHGGILYYLNDKEKEMIKEFETKHNALTYHVIHNYTSIGEMYSILYVSQYEEEWKEDINDIKKSYALVYVKNIDDDYSSEFGTIGIKPMSGGVIRTA